MRHAPVVGRAVFLVSVCTAVVLGVGGCAGRSGGSSDYRHKVANTAQTLDSDVSIAILQAQTVQRNKSLAPTLKVTLAQAYSDAGSTVEGFTSVLPPSSSDAALQQSVGPLLTDTVTGLRQARVAVGQGREQDLVQMIPQLQALSARLGQLKGIA